MGPVFTPLGGGGARAVSAREAQGDAQAVGVVFSGGAAAVAVHGFGNQCQAEAAVFFAVQGVVALKEARQGVVRHGRARRVVQGDAGFLAVLADGKGDYAACRRFAHGVVEQVGQRLFEPEGVGVERDGGVFVGVGAVMTEAQGEVFLCEARLLFALVFVPEGGKVQRLFVDGFFFDARQL